MSLTTPAGGAHHARGIAQRGSRDRQDRGTLLILLSRTRVTRTAAAGGHGRLASRLLWKAPDGLAAPGETRPCRMEAVVGDSPKWI